MMKLQYRNIIAGVLLAVLASPLHAGGNAVPGNTEGQGATDVGTESIANSLPTPETETISDGELTTTTTTAQSPDGVVTTTEVSTANGVFRVTETTLLASADTGAVNEVVSQVSLTEESNQATFSRLVNGVVQTSFSVNLSAQNTIIIGASGRGIDQSVASAFLNRLDSSTIPASARVLLRNIVLRSVANEN